MIDFIVVGFGLAGLTISRELEKLNKTFVVIDNSSQNASFVAGGLYNPVVLKRFTLAWQADKQLAYALQFYKELENDMKISFHQKMPIYRRFASIEEQNNWFLASDKLHLSGFLDPNLKKEINPCLKGDFSFGKVNQTGVINTAKLIDGFRAILKEKDKFLKEGFQYEKLISLEDSFNYKNFTAKGIIFCEGLGLKQNPFFNYLPLVGNKGEYLKIKAPELKLETIVKSSVFIIPLGHDCYKVGATYSHGDNTREPTKEKKKYLLKQLDDILDCKYEIINQEAGIRPSTIDRRPLVGKHPNINNMYVCNGFGSRGVLIAPTAASELLKHIEEGKTLDEEMDINRFDKEFSENL